MGNLLEAAQKQIDYAVNEFRSGDSAKGNEHLTKAKDFIRRAAEATPPVEGHEGEDAAPEAADELDIATLPKNHTAAVTAIASYLGVEDTDPGEGISSQASDFFEKTEDKPEIREALTVLGIFGNPSAAYPGVDYEPYTRYFEQAPGYGGQNWQPKNQSEIGDDVPAWEQFLASKA